MPRAEPKSVTSASVTGSPLSRAEKVRLTRFLTRRGFKYSAAKGFAASINSAIVYAYQLEPAMATRSQRAAWWHRVQTAIGKLQGALDLDARESLAVDSEDLQSLNAELCRHFRVRTRSDNPLADVLGRLARHCDTKKKALTGRDTKPKSRRQILANSLASAWRQHLVKKPTASVSYSRNGAKYSPFIEVLRSIIQGAENHYGIQDDKLTDNALRGLATRANTELKRRDAMVRRYQHK